jgi:C4-dicarboxylate-binding protein DctP
MAVFPRSVSDRAAAGMRIANVSFANVSYANVICANASNARTGALTKFERGKLMKNITIAVALAAYGLMASLGGQVQAQEAVVIKFSHVVAPNTPKGKAAVRFKELAEKYTDGKVKVDVYPNSQLYKDKEELEALQLGAVQMLAPSFAKFGPLGAKEFEAFDLPFIFPDTAALRKVTDGPIGKSLFAKLEDKGIKGLAFWDNGFKIMSANKPLKTPDDMLGLKMRIQSSKVLEAEMKAFGSIPQVMAFSEVYLGLQTGVVDGTENPPSNMYTQKMHEVQKYATLTNHGYLGYAVIVNKKFWDELPADVRTNLEKAMAEATVYANEIAQKENDDALDAMKKSGKTEFHTLTPEEKKAWMDAAKPVHQEMAGRIGKELLESIYAATGASMK